MTKPKIFFVQAVVEHPNKRCPEGRNADGAYVLDGNIVTLVHPIEGWPAEDSMGKRYTETLPDNFLQVDVENAARRLTLEFRKARRGNVPRGFSGGGSRGFGGPIRYGDKGWR